LVSCRCDAGCFASGSLCLSLTTVRSGGWFLAAATPVGVGNSLFHHRGCWLANNLRRLASAFSILSIAYGLITGTTASIGAAIGAVGLLSMLVSIVRVGCRRRRVSSVDGSAHFGARTGTRARREPTPPHLGRYKE